MSNTTNKCTWKANPEDYNGHSTSCGEVFFFNDWEESLVFEPKFCMYCGGKAELEAVQPTEEPEMQHFIKVSNLWQKTTDIALFSSLPRFKIEIFNNEEREETLQLLNNIKGQNIKISTIEEVFDVEVLE